MERYSARWWAWSVMHNMVIHPALPAMDLLDWLGCKRLPAAVYWLHDNIAPPGAG